MTDALKQHPLSAAFPAISAEAFAELSESIAARGLRHPITVYQGAVLDGWHRHRACQETGAQPHYEVFTGDENEAREFVVDENVKRRHLDPSQRAILAARFATIPHGGDRRNLQDAILRLEHRPTNTALSDAATLFNISERSISDGRAVIASGDAGRVADVEAGRVSVSRAAKQIRDARPKPAAKTSGLARPIPAIEIAPCTLEQWAALDAKAKLAHLAYRDPKAALNAQSRNEDDNLIDWAKWTWNPVTGCLHNCPYCYARDIAERFSGTPGFPNGFAPTLRAERLAAPINGVPRKTEDARDRRIFTGSMTDLFGRWVPAEWIDAVLAVVREAKLWDFLMLTKFPGRLAEFDIPENAWVGTSVDCQARVKVAENAFAKVKAKVRWLSCEPMIEPLRFKHLDRFDLLVIGGASASSKTPRWIPPFTWLDDLMRQADEAGCAVFLKSNLYRKEQPGGVRYRISDRAPDVFHYLAQAGENPDQKAA